MKRIRILDSSGDTVIDFDEASAEQLARAKEVFDGWMAKKRPAFLTKRAEGKPDTQIKSFGEIEEGAEVILVPAITAG